MESIGEEGVCPICNETTLEYDAVDLDGSDVIYPWRCSNCGATGLEHYTLKFDTQEIINK